MPLVLYSSVVPSRTISVRKLRCKASISETKAMREGVKFMMDRFFFMEIKFGLQSAYCEIAMVPLDLYDFKNFSR